jgi:hypothetical protein
MNEDWYTITQTLGKYYNNDNEINDNKLPSLHNLMYASKHIHAASLDRYKKEECNMHITINEIKKYLKSKPDHKVGLLVVHQFIVPSHIVEAHGIALTHLSDDIYFMEVKMSNTYYDKDENMIGMNTLDPLYKSNFRNVCEEKLLRHDTANVEKLVDLLFVQNVSTINSDIVEQNVLLDVLTIYNILTNRATCVRLIKNYAKNITLSIFSNFVRSFVAANNIPTLNLYLYINAEALGINMCNYQPLLASRFFLSSFGQSDMIDCYISETETERINLIHQIEKRIQYLV